MNHFMKMKEMVGYAASRGAPIPAVSVPLTGLMLIAGGIGVGLGLFAFIAIILVLAFLVLAAFIMHTPRAADDGTCRHLDSDGAGN